MSLPATYIVENADGRFEYMEVRYAMVRFREGPWARLYELTGTWSMGWWKLRKQRG